MRIIDLSSYWCSSDLVAGAAGRVAQSMGSTRPAPSALPSAAASGVALATLIQVTGGGASPMASARTSVNPAACRAAWWRRAGSSLPYRPSATLLARSEEHTSELQSLMCLSYADFSLKKKKMTKLHNTHHMIILVIHIKRTIR